MKLERSRQTSPRYFLDRDIYPLSFASIHPTNFCYSSHTTCAYFQSSALLRTDLSMLKAPRQWLESAALICLVALLLSAMGPSGYLHNPHCRGLACIIHARFSSDISRSKTCLAFPSAWYCITFVCFLTTPFTPSSRNPLVHLGPDY